MRLPYESNEALEIEYRVMETIYYGAMLETIDLSRKYGSYERFTESPFFYGKFQFDLWDDKKTKMWDWEIKQKWVIDHALARAPFVDQSQSMNLYFEKIDINKVKSALFYGWKKGIKTGSYYMRTQAASNIVNNISNEITHNLQVTECSTCSA